MKQNQHLAQDDFRVHPGGRRAPAHSAGTLIRHAKHQALKQSRRSRGGMGRGKHAGRSPLFTNSPQRVTVKANYYKHTGKNPGQRLRRHVQYLQRQAATVHDERPQAYSAELDQMDAAQEIKSWEGDKYHFRWVVSPENAERINRNGDLRNYIREVMGRVERDLETKLEWFAVNHHNTDNPHAHIVIRGVDDQGQELRIHPDYIKSGIRHRASEVATELLGPRDPREVEQARLQEVTANRVTGLDRRIEANLDPKRTLDMRQGADNGIPAYERSRVLGRLQHLEELGLAREPKHGRWAIAEGFLEDLKALGRQGDITKRLFDHSSHWRMPDRAAFVREYEVTSFDTPPVRGLVVAKGQHDELGTRNFVVVRDAGNRDHYVTVSDKIDLSQIREGSLVEAGPLKLPDGRAEQAILRQAQRHGGVYDPEAHIKALESSSRIENPEGYVGLHVARLKTLEQQGHVQKLENGTWRVPPDLVERGLAEAEQMRANPILQRWTRLTNLSGKPLHELTNSKSWTYLDRTLEKHPEGLPAKHKDAPFLGQALRERKNWLVENGHGRDTGGRFAFDQQAKAILQAAGRAPAQTKDRGRER